MLYVNKVFKNEWIEVLVFNKVWINVCPSDLLTEVTPYKLWLFYIGIKHLENYKSDIYTVSIPHDVEIHIISVRTHWFILP